MMWVKAEQTIFCKKHLSTQHILNMVKMKFYLIFLLLYCLRISVSAQTIHRTACNGDLERLDSLLMHNDIDIRDDRGRSLLHWAVGCKKKEVFDFLIDKGIDINVIDHHGESPMHTAVQFDNEEYLNNLIALQTDASWQTRFSASLLEIAVLRKNIKLIKTLVNQGVDINATNARGSTALEMAKRMDAQEVSKVLISSGADPSLVRVFVLQGKYIGQIAPEQTPKVFAPNFISTEENEFGSVFNKAGTEFYFGVDVGERNEIRFSEMIDGQWSQPKTIISHEIYGYNDPFLSNDENRMYFISNQTLDATGKPKDIDIWYAERTEDGWSAPIHAGDHINTQGNEYYISFTEAGTLYFSSDGHARNDSTRTDHDIYYSTFVNNAFQQPILLGETVNTKGYEADVFVAPDESYLIFCSVRENGMGRGDLYISFKNAQGAWTEAINMGDEINTQHYEYCPFVTKDGKYLFYTSNQDIYWVSTDILKDLRNEAR